MFGKKKPATAAIGGSMTFSSSSSNHQTQQHQQHSNTGLSTSTPSNIGSSAASASPFVSPRSHHSHTHSGSGNPTVSNNTTNNTNNVSRELRATQSAYELTSTINVSNSPASHYPTATTTATTTTTTLMVPQPNNNSSSSSSNGNSRQRSNSVSSSSTSSNSSNIDSPASPKSSSSSFKAMTEFGNAKGLFEFIDMEDTQEASSVTSTPTKDKKKDRSMTSDKKAFFKEYSRSEADVTTSDEQHTKHKHNNLRRKEKSDSQKRLDTDYPEIQQELVQLFNLPKESLLSYYSCSFNNGKQGRMYISSNFVCFSNGEIKCTIQGKSILLIEKLSVKLFPAVEIITSSNEYLFTHFFSRDNACKLLSKLFSFNIEYNRSVYTAIVNQDVDRLTTLFKFKTKLHPNFDESGEQGDLALHAAIKNRNVQIVDMMLKYYRENNLDINQKDTYGWTCLHQAVTNCTGKNVEDTVLKTLLDFPGAQVNAVNNDNNSVLHYFAQHFCSPSCQELGEILIKRGANVNARNKNNETPLHKALFNNSVRILMVDLLIKNGADVTILNTENLSVLHYAVILGRRDLLKILLHAGAVKSISIRSNKDHQTPYELAVQTKQEKIAEILKKVQDLQDWLNELELGELIVPFMKEDLYLEVLGDVDESHIDSILSNMKIETTGSRIKLFKAITKRIEETKAAKRTDTSPGSPKDVDGVQSFKERLKSAKLKDTPAYIDTPLPSSLTSAIQDSWLIKHTDLEYTKKLGSGASGKVYKGLYKGVKVAVKVLKTGTDQEELSRVYEEFRKEFSIMSVVRSPFVVGFYGACLEPKICMIMEYCSRGSLYNVLASNISIGWDLGLKFALQTTLGLKALHTFSPPIYHRDLKSLNILVTEDFTVKITDFGLARFNTADNMKTFSNVVGTIGYSAPEVLSGLGYTDKSDIWSMAMILFEIFHRVIYGVYQRPYEEFGHLAEYLVVAKVVENNLTPTIPHQLPEFLISFMQKCWSKSPSDRPTVNEMVEVLQVAGDDLQHNPENWNQRIIIGQKVTT